MPSPASAPILRDRVYRDLLVAARRRSLPLTTSQVGALAEVVVRSAESFALPLCRYGAVDVLNARHVQILVGIGRGATNTQIGAALGINADTVKSHVHRLFERLGVDSRVGAVVTGLRRGIITLEDIADGPPPGGGR